MAPLTVVVPLGGIGKRFQDEGHFSRPKPFVRVFGKEMILWVLDNLSLSEEDALVIAFNPKFMDIGNFMKEVVGGKYPKVHLVHLPGPTRGAAETVLLALQGIPEDIRRRPVMLCDGDCFYTADIVGMYRAVSATHNASFVFHDTQPKPIYSYCRVDPQKSILETREKVKISDWANSGCYCFKNGVQLATECEAMLKAGEMQLSQDKQPEYYTSGVIARMLERKEPFKALEVKPEDINVLGTPTQVQEWCGARKAPSGKSFAFSFAALRKSTGEPAADVVTFCKEMYAQGNHITVLTLPLGFQERQEATSWLAAQNVQYHVLDVGGDVACDFYVGKDALDPLLGNLNKQTGFYSGGQKVESAAAAPSRGGGSTFGLGFAVGAAVATVAVLILGKSKHK